MMKDALLRCVPLLALCMLAGKAHAQAACPPGMVPYGTGTDISTCGPDDSQQQGSQQSLPPPALWVERWGAIATDFAHSSAGASVDQKDKKSAEQAAMANCRSNGGVACEIELDYANGCAVLVIGKTGHNAKAGETIESATHKAMEVCKAADTKCFVYYSACSLPVRVR